MGGGRVGAGAVGGRDKEGRPEVRFRGLPPSFPVEVILGLRPGAEVPREALRAEAEPQGEEPFLLEFSVPAKRTLAPGESCVLTLRHNGFDGYPGCGAAGGARGVGGASARLRRVAGMGYARAFTMSSPNERTQRP